MDKNSLIILVASCFIASTTLAETNWADTGKGWGIANPPEWISSKMTLFTYCEKISDSPRINRCKAGFMGYDETYSERYSYEDGTREIYLYFNNLESKRKAWESLEELAIQGNTVPILSSKGKGWFSKNYKLMNPGSNRIEIFIPDYLQNQRSVVPKVEDPKNSSVKFEGLTLGGTLDYKFYFDIVKPQRRGPAYKSNFTPKDFDSEEPGDWYSSKYVTNGRFWKLPGEKSSEIYFGDYGYLDKIFVFCEGDGVYDKLINRFSKDYKLKTKKQEYSQFQPKSKLCGVYNCPIIQIAKLGDMVTVSLLSNQSYIGDANYKYKWYEQKYERYLLRRKKLGLE